MRNTIFRDVMTCALVEFYRLPAVVLETLSCKPSNFRKRVKKVINKAKLRGDQRSEVK
jgi:hypothetical protein